MTIIKHELRQEKKTLILWTTSITFFLVICVVLYPQMKNEMQDVSDIFASMGSFTAAFGMDRLDFGTLIGFYAIECGNILGIGGALFSALIAVNKLSKEEKDRTAEFLFSHPVSRRKVITHKLITVLMQLAIMNIIVFVVSVSSIAIIGESIPWKEITLLHTAYLFVQLELSGICFGISAFIRGNGFGVGIGIAIALYFMNIIANITEGARFLKYISPFGYADGADIISNGRIDIPLIVIGLLVGIVGVAMAYIRYENKDLH